MKLSSYSFFRDYPYCVGFRGVNIQTTLIDMLSIVSTGASCAFRFTASAFHEDSTIAFASDCAIQLLIWSLASVKIYRLGKSGFRLQRERMSRNTIAF